MPNRESREGSGKLDRVGKKCEKQGELECSVYFHFPFCHRICPYCDFHVTKFQSSLARAYGEALLGELEESLTSFDVQRVTSVYFGGGTPSLMEVAILQRCLELLQPFLMPAAEVTLEVNPEDVIQSRVSEWVACGINRFSLGGQALRADSLKVLGRRHTPWQLQSAVVAIQKECEAVSCDYIFGLPGQTLQEVVSDLQQLLEYNIPHLSTYELTVEPGTPFYSRMAQGAFSKPCDDTVAAMHIGINDHLQHAGYDHYEVSNFARKGFKSQHNLNYWKLGNYLGIGSGAHSFVALKENRLFKGHRWSNGASLRGYLDRESRTPAWEEYLGQEQMEQEFFLLGLRMRNGVSIKRFHTLFGSDVHSKYQTAIQYFSDADLLRLEGETLAATTRGRLLLDAIISDPVWSCRSETHSGGALP